MLGKLKKQPPEAFGAILRNLRENRGLTQEGLALDAGIQRNYVSLIERGINQPTITMIFKLASALGISPSEMVALVEEKIGSVSPDHA
jgi:transcriptional regulator with XRE-family HTH domain